MNLSVKSLPSKGLTLKPEDNITEVTLKPLVYKQLVKFTKKEYSNNIDKMVNNIEHIITDIPNWKKLSAYDVNSILFTRKYISASFEDSITIPIGDVNYKLYMNDINYKTISNELLELKEIKINGHHRDFHIPTIEEYFKCLKIVQSGVVPDVLSWIEPEDVMILAALGMDDRNAYDYINYYSMSSEDDLVTIEYLDILLNDSANDVTVKSSNGGESVVNVNDIITDIFRFIYTNRQLNKKSFKYSKNLPH